MDRIFQQTFTLAEITPLKNYSSIKNRKESTNTFSSDLDEISDNFKVRTIDESNELYRPTSYTSNTFTSYLHNFIPKEDQYVKGRKKNTSIKYFYNEKGSVGERIEIFAPTKIIKTYYTRKERHIKNFYSDPFTKIEVTNRGRVMYKDENKLIIKFFLKRKLRSFNWKFFREDVYGDMISFNLKTGNFTIIKNSDDKRFIKSKGRIRTNSFLQLKSFFTDRYYSLPKYGEAITKEYDEVMDDKEFLAAINEHLFNNSVENLTKDNLPEKIVEYFVKKKQIKVPNDYHSLLTNFYPTQKYLKKNDNKLIQSILDMYGIKCKGTVKLLHEHKVHIPTLVIYSRFFGDSYQKYITRINPKVLTKTNIGNKNEMYFFNDEVQEIGNFKLSKDEKENLLNVINDSILLRDIFDFYRTIRDHINMIIKIRDAGLDVKFNSKTYLEFVNEHSEFSKIITKIRRGYTFELQFDEKMLSDVEADLLSIKDESSLIKLKPYILKREEEYVEEGSFMHHCVAGYANNERSMIISLRTEDGTDRVTCEYNMQTGRMLQERYFCNKVPPKYFEDGLIQLRDKVEKYAKWGLLNWREKKKVPVIINGVEIIIKDPRPKTFHDVLLEDDIF